MRVEGRKEERGRSVAPRSLNETVQPLARAAAPGRVQSAHPVGFREGSTAAWGGVSERQRKKHIRWLLSLAQAHSWEAVVSELEKRRLTRPWRFSTTRTEIGAIMGAVPRADFYRLPCVLGKPTTAWTDYLKVIDRGVIMELATVAQALPMTVAHMARALGLAETDPPVMLFMLLMWALVARPGCALTVSPVHMQAVQAMLKVRFVEGKGVKMRGVPYTVHTHCPIKWNRFIAAAILNRADERYLFRQRECLSIRKRTLALIRRVDPKYQLYSFRRGAAITLQRTGAKIEEIMAFTGHASASMCSRYLEWGWWDVTLAKRYTTLAKQLW